MPDVPLIYANAVLGVSQRDGVYEVTLGAQGFEQAEARIAAGVALTREAAHALAAAVQGDAKAASEELVALKARYAELRNDAAHAGVVLTGMQEFATRLMREYRRQPDFEPILVRVANEVVRTLKATEVPGTAMADEAKILSQAIETFFDLLDAAMTKAVQGSR